MTEPTAKCALCTIRLADSDRHPSDPRYCLDCAPRLGLPDVRYKPSIEAYLVRSERRPIPD